MFTMHALNIMNTLDLAVQNLDKLDILVPKLRELGQMHAAFELTEVEFQVEDHLFIIFLYGTREHDKSSTRYLQSQQ